MRVAGKSAKLDRQVLLAAIAKDCDDNRIADTAQQQLVAQVARILHMRILNRHDQIAAFDSRAHCRPASIETSDQNAKFREGWLSRRRRTQLDARLTPPNIATGDPAADAGEQPAPQAQ
jgi:hypothetical protein